MSETYPKSSIWPFVLSGVTLMVFAIVPPSKVVPMAQRLYQAWGQSASQVTQLPRSPKIVLHSGGDDLRQTGEKQLLHRPVQAAPTTRVEKTKTHPPQTLGRSEILSRALANSAFVWQPPQGWIPELIEPYPFPEKLGQTEVPNPLVAAEVFAPVAKQERVLKLPQKKTPDPLSLNPDLPEVNVEPLQPSIPDDSAANPPATSVVDLSREKPPVQNMGDTYLLRLLEMGQSIRPLQNWTQLIKQQLSDLEKHEWSGSVEHRNDLNQLNTIANRKMDTRGWPPAAQTTYRRIRYAVQRRIAIWRPLLNVASQENEAAVANDHATELARSLNARLLSSAKTKSWTEYLQLEQLVTSRTPHLAAETTLLRLRADTLSPDQQVFLSNAEFGELETALRNSIALAVTPQAVSQALQRYEAESSRQSAADLLSVLERFADGSDVDRYLPTLQAINVHYRNANFRVAVTEELINRFVPAFHQYAEQVNDTILGASVRGNNSTWANLAVRLVPDEANMRLALLAKGQVQSNTSSRKGPVTFYNQGASRFAAGKELVLSPQGVFLGQTETRAATGSRVVGMKSDWDDIPFVGWIIRALALQRHDEQRPFLRAEILKRVRRQASTKLDVEVHRRLAAAEQQIQSRLVRPLRELHLDPRAMEMRTTSQRVILRTRLAGPLQLGSHTPRPRALGDSKMSLQLHQTAANNLVDQLGLEGRRMTLAELAAELTARFGIELDVSERRRGIVVEFAKQQPLEFHFHDGKVEVAIHFASLTHGDEQWNDFSVRSAYRADIRRLNVELVRDGSIELITESSRLRDQIALRSIFTKVFDSNHRLDVLRQAIQNQPKLRSLEVSRLTIRDGWISLSIGEPSVSSLAERANVTTR